MAYFGSALEEMKRGGPVTRMSWPANLNMTIQLQVPDEHSKMTMPYIYLAVGGDRYPWLPAMADLMADDWSWTKKSKLIVPSARGLAVN